MSLADQLRERACGSILEKLRERLLEAANQGEVKITIHFDTAEIEGFTATNFEIYNNRGSMGKYTQILWSWAKDNVITCEPVCNDNSIQIGSTFSWE